MVFCPMEEDKNLVSQLIRFAVMEDEQWTVSVDSCQLIVVGCWCFVTQVFGDLLIGLFVHKTLVVKPKPSNLRINQSPKFWAARGVAFGRKSKNQVLALKIRASLDFPR
jgi:hypothetical protein